MRVLLTGMGGQLGTLVARILEARDDVESIVGYDLDPPRRRLHRAVFHHIDPADAERVADVVRDAAPTVALHLGVYEPHARLSPSPAHDASNRGVEALARALEEHAPSLEAIVARSGIEVYGRNRGVPRRPDEDVPPAPTTDFGRTLLDVEDRLAAVAESAAVPLTSLRFAPLVGSHVPSPLGRLLKLAVVPFNALADPAFALLHADDAASALEAALFRRVDGPVNVVASGAVTASQTARIGGRFPMPTFGPGWTAAQIGTELVSAPLPSHVRELLVRGRVADGGRSAELLGVAPTRTTRDVVTELYEQLNVIYLPVAAEAAA